MPGPQSRLSISTGSVEAMAALGRFDSLELFVSAANTSDSMEGRESRFNQPDVSRAVLHLERYLGLRLVERRARVPRLTEAGVVLHESAKKCFGHFKLAASAVAGQ